MVILDSDDSEDEDIIKSKDQKGYVNDLLCRYIQSVNKKKALFVNLFFLCVVQIKIEMTINMTIMIIK